MADIIHIKNMTPKGIIDGTNKSFVLPTIQVPGTLVVRKNGLTELEENVLEQQGAFILDEAPLPGDIITCDFIGAEVTSIFCP